MNVATFTPAANGMAYLREQLANSEPTADVPAARPLPRPTDDDALIQERIKLCIRVSNAARDMWLALVSDLRDDLAGEDEIRAQRDAAYARIDELADELDEARGQS